MNQRTMTSMQDCRNSVFAIVAVVVLSSSLSLTWSSRRSFVASYNTLPVVGSSLLFGCPLSIFRPTTIEPHYSLCWSFTHALVTSSSHAVPLTSEFFLSLSSRNGVPLLSLPSAQNNTSASAPASSLFQSRLRRGTRDPLKNPTTTATMTTIGTRGAAETAVCQEKWPPLSSAVIFCADVSLGFSTVVPSFSLPGETLFTYVFHGHPMRYVRACALRFPFEEI